MAYPSDPVEIRGGGPLAPLFAQAREARKRAVEVLPPSADVAATIYHLDRLDAALSSIERHVQDMVSALEPFARDAEAFDRAESTYGDGSVFERMSGEHYWRFTIADVRRAAAALSVPADLRSPLADHGAREGSQEGEK